MSNVLSFYLDGTIVQAVRAHISDQGVTVKDARTFPHHELESYLSDCREKVCILCCNPSLFYQDIVHLPLAAEKFYDNLIRAEVRKEHPDLAGFTVFHRTIGQATIDGALYNKIAAFSYSDESLDDFISLFNRNGMMIANLYAAPYPIFSQAVSTCAADFDQARIFIATLPGEKLILLGETGELEFIRKVPSPESALLPADIQNINMTIDYCFQSLRVKASEAVMLAPPETSGEPSPPFSVPFRYALPPALAGVSSDTVRDYLAPLAAVLHHVSFPGQCDILPSDYVSFKQHKKILAAMILIQIGLALFLAGLILTERMVISDLKDGIGSLRGQLNRADADIAAFRKLDDELRAFDKPIAILNRLNSCQNPETALAALTLPRSADYSLKTVALKKGEGFVNVHLEGTITSSGYRETQAIFEGVVAQVRKIPGYSVSSSTVDVKQKSFIIEARYNGGGQKGT